MTDPSVALASFERALRSGAVQVRRGELDPEIYVHADRVEGLTRLTYVRIVGSDVVALANFTTAEPINGEPCFQVGYAVREDYRSHGIATDMLRSAIKEFSNGFARNGVPVIHFEAVIGVDNVASRCVAAKVLGPAVDEGLDELSGEPAVQHVRRVVAGR